MGRDETAQPGDGTAGTPMIVPVRIVVVVAVVVVVVVVAVVVRGTVVAVAVFVMFPARVILG
jgi:hypothetical protein